MGTPLIVDTMNGGNTRKRKTHKLLVLVNSIAVISALFSTYCFIFEPITLLPKLQQTKKQNHFQKLIAHWEANDSNISQTNVVGHNDSEEETKDPSLDFDDDDDDFLGSSKTPRTLSLWKSINDSLFGQKENTSQKTHGLRKHVSGPT